MKIIGIVESPRTKGNSETLTRIALTAAEKERAETEQTLVHTVHLHTCMSVSAILTFR
jgi:multimeric flavodoxin WrbA